VPVHQRQRVVHVRRLEELERRHHIAYHCHDNRSSSWVATFIVGPTFKS
jgi:hypothetical protein